LPSFLRAGSDWESMGVFDVGDVNMNFPTMTYVFVEDGSIELRLQNNVLPNFPTYARWDFSKHRATEMVYEDSGSLEFGDGLEPFTARFIDDKFYALQAAEGSIEYYTKDKTTMSPVLNRYLYPNSAVYDARIGADKSFSFSGELDHFGVSLACLRVYNQATGQWDAHLSMLETNYHSTIRTGAFSSGDGGYTGYLILNINYPEGWDGSWVLAKTTKNDPLPSPRDDGFNYYQLELLEMPNLESDTGTSQVPTEPHPGILHSGLHIQPISLETTDSWFFASTALEWYWPDYSVQLTETPVISTFRLDKAGDTVEPVMRHVKLPEGASIEGLRFASDGSLYTTSDVDMVFTVYKITSSGVTSYPIELNVPGEDFYYTLGPMEIYNDVLYVGLMRPGYMYNAFSPYFELIRMEL
ncbi:MAG: hypothetical protein CVU65_08815, partial [Deltaproteobacteria bacterium HGW-Deltaproteobacteria-22]